MTDASHCSFIGYRPLIERAFEATPEVRTVVFEPNDAGPSDKMAKTKEVPKMTPGRAVLVSLFEKYLAGNFKRELGIR